MSSFFRDNAVGAVLTPTGRVFLGSLLDTEWTYGELLEKFQDINADIQIIQKKIRVLIIVCFFKNDQH